MKVLHVILPLLATAGAIQLGQLEPGQELLADDSLGFPSRQIVTDCNSGGKEYTKRCRAHNSKERDRRSSRTSQEAAAEDCPQQRNEQQCTALEFGTIKCKVCPKYEFSGNLTIPAKQVFGACVVDGDSCTIAQYDASGATKMAFQGCTLEMTEASCQAASFQLAQASNFQHECEWFEDDAIQCIANGADRAKRLGDVSKKGGYTMANLCGGNFPKGCGERTFKSEYDSSSRHLRFDGSDIHGIIEENTGAGDKCGECNLEVRNYFCPGAYLNYYQNSYCCKYIPTEYFVSAEWKNTEPSGSWSKDADWRPSCSDNEGE